MRRRPEGPGSGSAVVLRGPWGARWSSIDLPLASHTLCRLPAGRAVGRCLRPAGAPTGGPPGELGRGPAPGQLVPAGGVAATHPAVVSISAPPRFPPIRASAAGGGRWRKPSRHKSLGFKVEQASPARGARRRLLCCFGPGAPRALRPSGRRTGGDSAEEGARGVWWPVLRGHRGPQRPPLGKP